MKYLLLICFFFASSSAFCQSTVYLTNSRVVAASVSDIKDKKIKYRLADKKHVASVKIEEVILVFNAFGDYLTFKQGRPLFTTPEGIRFIKQASSPHLLDILVKKNGEVLAGSIVSDSDDKISGTTSKGIKFLILKADLTAVIKKDGIHTLYTTPESALDNLTNSREEIKNLLEAK